MPVPNLSKPARSQLGALFQEGVRSITRALPLCLGDGNASVRATRMESVGYADLQRHFGSQSGRILLVGFTVTGAFGGTVALWMKPMEVATLLETMVPGVHENGFDERAQAAFSEVCNILASSFLNVAADRLRSFCIPSVPHFAQVEIGELLANLPGLDEDPKKPANRATWQTRLTVERGEKRCELHLMALPDSDFDAGIARLS